VIPVSSAPLNTGEKRAVDQMVALRILWDLSAGEAIGAACAVLLKYSVERPELVRRALNEPVIKNGFRGTSLLKTLTRT
jgi:hypothetical protein